MLAVRAPWLQLQPPCSNRPGKSPAPCLAALASPIGAARPVLAREHRGTTLPRRTLPRRTLSGTLGGVKSLDVVGADRLSAGPQLSWFTPDSPREDLLRLRVVSPGWAVRYTWKEAHVAVGVAAFTRFVMFGEDWPVVDMLTSEARFELELP